MTEDERQERADRLRVIALEMDALVRDLGPKWIRLGHLRNESQGILLQLSANLPEPTP